MCAGRARKNAPVPLQGQMRENTSAVPPCLAEESAHLSRMPTHPKPANAGSASRNTHGKTIFRAPSAVHLPVRCDQGFSLAPTLCACAAGLISASTVSHSIAWAKRQCKGLFCTFRVFAAKQNRSVLNLSLLIRRRQTEIVSAGFPGGAGRFRHPPKPFLTFFTAVSLRSAPAPTDELTVKNACFRRSRIPSPLEKVAAATFSKCRTGRSPRQGNRVRRMI